MRIEWICIDAFVLLYLCCVLILIRWNWNTS